MIAIVIAINMRCYYTTREILVHTANNGFCCVLANAKLLNELIQALRKLQFTVTKTSLYVKQPFRSRPNTLSAKYGPAAFPFHTDFAFRGTPPRYILLVNPTDLLFQRPTLIAPIEMLPSHLKELIRLSTWKLTAAGKHYLVSGQFNRNGQKVWRWDCDFLSPANDEAHAARVDANVSMLKISTPVMWSPQSAVLIDNWYCAHARGNADENDKLDISRSLLRLEFWGDARVVL
jgi:hypothetical protein